jgi:hypothetical protein
MPCELENSTTLRANLLVRVNKPITIFEPAYDKATDTVRDSYNHGYYTKSNEVKGDR